MNAMKTRLDSMETHLDEYGIVPLHGSGTTNTKNWSRGEWEGCGWVLGGKGCLATLLLAESDSLNSSPSLVTCDTSWTNQPL